MTYPADGLAEGVKQLTGSVIFIAGCKLNGFNQMPEK